MLYSKSLHISPGGHSISSYESFSQFLWEGINEFDSNFCTECTAFSTAFDKVYRTSPNPLSIDELNLPATAEKTAKVYGRTVVVSGPDGPRALKFRKIEERVSTLSREAAAIKLMKEKKFHSLLPEPEGVFWVANTPEWIRRRVPGISREKRQSVYCFKPPPGYYHYPNDPQFASQNWEIGIKRWLLDLGRLIAAGQMPIAAPLFHNNENNRLYQILVDLFRYSNNGAGRISNPLKGVAHPNVSLKTGARDFGDFIPISELVKNPLTESPDLWHLDEEKAKRYFPMAAAAKTVLVFALLLIDRIDKANRLNWQNPDVVKELAKNLKQGQTWLLHGITGQSESRCRAFAENSPVDWERCAKQMIFWMQATEEGYLGALKKERLPDGLYDPKTLVDIDIKEAKNYTPDGGFRTAGERDYGCFNGSLMLLELEKLCYVTSVFASGLDHNHQ